MNLTAAAAALYALADALLAKPDAKPDEESGSAVKVKEAAAALGVNGSTAIRMLQSGKLRGYRVGKRGWRVYRSSVEALRQGKA